MHGRRVRVAPTHWSPTIAGHEGLVLLERPDGVCVVKLDMYKEGFPWKIHKDDLIVLDEE